MPNKEITPNKETLEFFKKVTHIETPTEDCIWSEVTEERELMRRKEFYNTCTFNEMYIGNWEVEKPPNLRCGLCEEYKQKGCIDINNCSYLKPLKDNYIPQE